MSYTEIHIQERPTAHEEGSLYSYNTDRLFLLNFGGFNGESICDVMCEICEEEALSPTYVYIINCLKEANLLPKDYKLLCCWCYIDEQRGYVDE